MSFSGPYYDGQVIRQSDGPAIKLVGVTWRIPADHIYQA